MATEKIEILKFNRQAENFSAWKRNFLAVLTIKDLHYVLEPKVDKSKGLFTRDNAKVYTYITLSMDTQTAIMLDTHCRGDGNTAWKELLGMYKCKDKLQIASLRSELENLQLDEGEDAENFIMKITQIGQDLADAQGSPIDDDELVTTLFMGLPASYEP